jgi:alkyldihydroxyacetonephosphate synthase
LTEPRRDTRWWGWGDPDEPADLGEAGERLLSERGIDTVDGATPPELTQVKLPEAAALPDAVVSAAGSGNVFTSDEDRIRHANGQNYLDLLALRAGELELAPDAVILPESADRIAPILEACAAAGVAVVPFGGGSSVVGGVTPLKGEHGAVISLDLAALRGIEVDERSLTAKLGAGLRGPEAEALLAERGYTLGHFPQSFEYATVGGFAATRSAGQSSSGYGRFDSLVSSIRLITPEAELSTLATPHTSIGPALREVAIGSEGILGVIPDVDVRIRPLPATRRYEAWIVEDFEAGNEIVRGLAQTDRLPTIIRISDVPETEVNLAMSLPSGAAGGLFRRYLKLRGRTGGSLLISGYEGTSAAVHRSRSDVARAIRKGGGVYLGQAAGRGWAKGRFHGPYLREALLDRGVLVETLETAQQWSGHKKLYEGVRSALEDGLKENGMEGIVMCHLSHAYRDGASLYFTVIAGQGPAGGAENWPKLKRAACEAIQSAGGTLSHHHATGRDHAPWVEGEIGPAGIDALRVLKERFDPAGIMNPGKILT